LGENPYRLGIPFFLVPLFFPLAFTSSSAVARGIWLCLGQVALVGSLVVSLVVIEWRPPRAYLVLLGAATVLGVYSVAAMFSGTPAIVLAFLYPTILWALQSGQDELAGSLLVFGCFLWEVGALFLVLIVWRMFYGKHGGAFAGFAMTLVILLAVAFLLYPGWVLPFLTATVAQLRSGSGIDASAALLRIWPEHGTQLARALGLCLGALFVYEWWSGRHADAKRFVWMCLLALSVTPLLGFRTDLGNLVVVSPSVVLICAGSLQRVRGGGGLAPAALGGVMVIPWLLAARWAVLQDAIAYDYLFLFYPLFSIAGLYWTRWWFLRPNRTWMDEVRALRA
jgi:hypothetical protein